MRIRYDTHKLCNDELWNKVKEYKLDDGSSPIRNLINGDVEMLRHQFDLYVEYCVTSEDNNTSDIVYEFIIYVLGYDRGVHDTEDILGNSNG